MTGETNNNIEIIHTLDGHRYAYVKDALRYGKFKHSKLYRLINDGRIRAKKFDSRTLIDLDSIDAMYASLPDLPPNPNAKS
jgi:hypothetical protein